MKNTKKVWLVLGLLIVIVAVVFALNSSNDEDSYFRLGKKPQQGAEYSSSR